MNEILQSFIQQLRPMTPTYFVIATDKLNTIDKYQYIDLISYLIKNEFNYLDYQSQDYCCEFNDKNCPYNRHHYSTHFLWNRIRIDLFKMMNIHCNSNDFKLIGYNQNFKYDMSFHQRIDDINVDFISYTYGERWKGNHLAAVRACVDGGNAKCNYSAYHKLFRGSHQTCQIENLTDLDNNRRLLLITDSMSIPLVPFLAYYFKSILQIDPREKLSQNVGTSIIDLINSYNYTDCLFFMQCGKFLQVGLDFCKNLQN